MDSDLTPVSLEAAEDATRFGGKAAQLATAINNGLPVPGGWALPVRFVDAVARGDDAAKATLRECLRGQETHVAVRSSAIGEDGAGASFAGQHQTYLGIRDAEAAIEAVRGVWDSAHGAGARAYRERLDITGAAQIAVVIQDLVEAESAGVLFTRDPISGADQRLVEAGWGFGEAVVSGLVTPDCYRISREGVVLERRPGVKERMLCLGDGNALEERPVQEDRVRTLCLDDLCLVRLHAIAVRCETVFGGDQDLEWARCGDQLYLLQRRPVTTAAVPSL